MSIFQQLSTLRAEHPEQFEHALSLSATVKDESKDPIERMRAANELSNIMASLMLKSLQDDLEHNASSEPHYEYRYIRGARVKVQVR